MGVTPVTKVIKGRQIGRLDSHSPWFKFGLIVLCFLFLGTVRAVMNDTLGGDEPAYLLMDYSLVHNGTFNLSKSYDSKSFQTFTPGSPTIQGSPAVGTKAPAKDYSQHGIGLPLFLAPGFAIAPLIFHGFTLAARGGAVLEMLMLATAVIVLTCIWTKNVTNNRKTAHIASGLLAISYFFAGLAGYIFPDILISALVLVALIMIERYNSKLIFHGILGIVLGFLVLVHVKDLDLVLPLLAIFSYVLWRTKRKVPWLTFVIVALFIGYYFYSYHQWFGIWGINSSNSAGGSQFGDNPLMSISAMMFDSFRGILVYNPIMILIFLGVPIWYKRNRKTLIIALLATLPSLAVLSIFFQWNGGDAPPARYIMDILPAFMPAIAYSLESLKEVWQKLVVAALTLITFLITVDAMVNRWPWVDPGKVSNQTRSPLFLQIQNHFGIGLDHFLPRTSQYLYFHTVFIDHLGLLKTLLCWLVVAIVFIYGCYLAKNLSRKQRKGAVT